MTKAWNSGGPILLWKICQIGSSFKQNNDKGKDEMPVNSQLNDEIRILTLFNLDTSLEGIKAHKSADPRPPPRGPRPTPPTTRRARGDPGLGRQNPGGPLRGGWRGAEAVTMVRQGPRF